VLVPSGAYLAIPALANKISSLPFPFFDLSEEPIEIVEIRHVSSNRANISSPLLGRRVQFRLTTPGDEVVGTPIYKPLRRGKADAAVAAGDKRNLSIELTELFLVSCHFPV
jgi:hypothetical protein